MNIPSSSSSASQTKQPKLKPEIYEPLEPLVRRLYLKEGKSLGDIAGILTEETGVTITVSQVIQLVNATWGFRKRLALKDHEYIDYKKRKREEDGKLETRVKLCGILQSEGILSKKKARRREPTHERLAKAHQPPPKTPDGLEVGTPTPRPASERSPAALICSPQDTPTPFYIMSYLYEGLPSQELNVIFQSIMTQLHEGRSPAALSPVIFVHRSIPTLLSTSETHSPASSISRIANPDSSFSNKEILEILQPLVVQFGNRADEPRKLREALDKFTRSDIPTRLYTMLKAFFRNPTLVIDDFAAQTFYSAARTGNINLLKLFIELDILKRSPNSRWHSHAKIIGATALQFSIEYRQGPSTSLLLRDKNIDVNAQPVSDLSQSILKTAVEVQDLDLVNQLLDMGAEDIVFNERYGVEGDPARLGYLSELYEAGIGWARPIREDLNKSLYTITALHSAITLPSYKIFNALLQNRIKRMRSGQTPIPFDSLLHVAAVQSLKIERLKLVLECDALDIEINGRNVYGDTALEVAMRMGSISDIRDCFTDRYSHRDWSSDTKDALNHYVRLLVRHGATIESQTQPQTQPLGNGVFYKLIVDSVHLGQLYRILDTLQSSSPSFPWISYRQSLESLGHSGFRILQLKIAQTSNPASYQDATEGVTASFQVKVVISFDKSTCTKAFRSIETISGSLFYDLPIHPLGGAFQISFQFYSRDLSFNTLYLEIDSEETEQPPQQGEMDGDLSSFNEKEVLEALRVLEERLASNINSHGRIYTPAIHWARQNDNPEICTRLINLYSDEIQEMPAYELSTFLALAVHSNSHRTIKKIIPYVQSVDKISALEAAWNGDNKTFELILNLAQQNAVYNFGVPPELLTLIAIHAGHTYKVIRLLDQVGVKANHILEGGTTFLETAAVLGRLDIARVLLNAGASDRLLEAKAKADQFGHFVLSNIINEKIIQLRPDESMAIHPDSPGPTTESQITPEETVTPAPVITEPQLGPIDIDSGNELMKYLFSG
ncbi:hypothetical protein TWF718_000709 [Orbilia javanica]|uniref:Uncharacterized protein n=1 Tax=Orbilia javanica TaxID=47235 RepID=A0AAN8MXI0_9PEZI